MSSIKLVLLPLLAASTAMHPTRQPAATAPICPVRHLGIPLKSLSVFDGPVSDNADLVPDSSRKIRGGEESRWDVAYVYQAGRIIYASCRYGTQEPLVVPVSHPVRACRYSETHAGNTLTCR